MTSDIHSITTHLLSQSTKPSYLEATSAHPFIASAANGTLSNDLLSFWLYQDRIYAAHAYPPFIGSLIANIPFDRTSQPNVDASKRILDILNFSLQNIVREVEFFENTATQWGLRTDGWKERKGTRDYTAEMARISRSGSVEEGLLFLWAMERIYLDAWMHVHNKLTSDPQTTTPSPVMVFATNWSTPEFQSFVIDLGNLVDDLYQNGGPKMWKRAEDIWQRTVELEEAFWPVNGEEVEFTR
ncbi:heme oxygenase-like protein [Collybia nuda]|uniref:Heme oxygenase-like protein n=1 Tax=Collybia nuda TaxID=64659 RepID=A0A9P5YF38_9AGAR|nr:heme oxygenase-like protein [Collybia nuda]